MEQQQQRRRWRRQNSGAQHVTCHNQHAISASTPYRCTLPFRSSNRSSDAPVVRDDGERCCSRRPEKRDERADGRTLRSREWGEWEEEGRGEVGGNCDGRHTNMRVSVHAHVCVSEATATRQPPVQRGVGRGAPPPSLRLRTPSALSLSSSRSLSWLCSAFVSFSSAAPCDARMAWDRSRVWEVRGKARAEGEWVQRLLISTELDDP